MFVFGKKILVVGMESSGISVTGLLLKNGANVYCYDDKKVKKVEGANIVSTISEELIDSCDIIVPSPSIPPSHRSIVLAKKKHKKILGEMEIGCSFLEAKKIMVTGTNGKTTIVTMIEKILSVSGYKTKAMGNIGYPVSQAVLDGLKLDYAVIEVSSFQLEYIDTLCAHISVITNIAPDHMDRYVTFSDYVATKGKILKNQKEEDYFLFNADDGNVRKFLLKSVSRNIPISINKTGSPVYIKNNYFMLGEESLVHVKKCKVRGEHNKQNLLFALNVGYICGCKKEHFCKLISDYVLLPNRIEYVVTLDGKAFYNDSKGTNIHACRTAIKSMDGSVALIMGGSDKKEDFCELFEDIDERVKYVAISGGNQENIYNSAMKMGYTDIGIFNSLSDAVTYIFKNIDVQSILLSPASASFDRYKNYAERGEKYKEIVYALKK